MPTLWVHATLLVMKEQTTTPSGNVTISCPQCSRPNTSSRVKIFWAGRQTGKNWQPRCSHCGCSLLIRHGHYAPPKEDTRLAGLKWEDMSVEQHLMFLAELDGYTDVYAPVEWMPQELTGIYTFRRPDKPDALYAYVSRKPVPHYMLDLDAVHRLETKLSDTEFGLYRMYLLKITSPKEIGMYRSPQHERRVISATAAERCEAIIKALTHEIKKQDQHCAAPH